MVDPIVIPSTKTLPLAPVLGGWIINYITTDLEPAENGYWYKYRPHQALKELNKITKRVRKDLQKGIDLPAGVKLTVFKAEKDDAADPASAVLIEKGIKGSKIKMLNTDLHVFTRLLGRASFSTSDKDLQLMTFEEIYNSL
ncbi:MAG: hypothetical protein IPJ60_08855 [Sphingobacteriaceae bacterium]|nr:hypothetical protein [Sphingobacteriaceae bacterium]